MMLLDAFMAWLVVVGGIQFVYCVLAGNYVCFPMLVSRANANSILSLLMPSSQASALQLASSS